MAQKNNRKRKNVNNTGNHDVLGMILVVISVFLLLCIVIKPILGVFSEAIFSFMLGVFGIVAYPMLLALTLLGVFLLLKRKINATRKAVVCTTLLILFALIILQLATTHHFLRSGFASYIEKVYDAKYSAGGVIMGTIAFGLKSVITEIACYIIFSVAIIAVVLYMTSAISRLRAYIKTRRNGKMEEEPAPSVPSMFGDEAQRVISAGPRSGLFVTTIERNAPEFSVESGNAADLPVHEKRNVSDYGESPVIDRRSDDESRTAAHIKLYGDAEELKKQAAAEFSKAHRATVQPEPAEPYYGEPYTPQDGLEEPYERVKADADKPRRFDYDGTPNHLHELFFPTQKDLEFNYDGIEDVDELKAALEAHNSAHIQREYDGIGGGSRMPEPFAPAFDLGKKAAFDPTEEIEIIDASAPRTPVPPPEPIAPPPEPIAPEPIITSAEERFMQAVEADHTPPLETEKFKQDDIIDAFEWGNKYGKTSDSDIQAQADDEELEEILDGSKPIPEKPVIARPVEKPDPAERLVISDDVLGGSLIISDAPAVDMSETRDNVSDIINGDDLSGMYISADDDANQPAPQKPAPAKRQKANAPLPNQMSIDNVLKDQAENSVMAMPVRKYKKYNYAPPPIDLLKTYEKVDSSDDELQANSTILEQVVSGFLKTTVKVIKIVPGPQVTQYELDVPSGTSVKNIQSHCQDIEYELAAVSGVRVEAPIPGKRAVGIEVPNKTKSIVGLREVVDSATFAKPKSPLVFSVGKDIGGSLIVCDLEKVPHLLIAGQTGSGKSAGLNSLIVSLLYKSSPEDLRFILIDPKRVEFSKFRGMPHLLFEKTITEPTEALNALKWAATEMERRFTVMAKYACSKLSEYNEMPDVVNGNINKLPHIVIIIDELANLMQSAVSGEIESKISSIAALARAAGIHLIVATQRPSADVITGTIKANLTSRIAFKVPDATNSRIIIDEVGAEALSGDGDMLFYPQDYYAPKRIQGSFVSGEEVLSVVGYLKEHYECDFDLEAERFVCGGGNGCNGGDGGESSEGGGNLDPLAQRIMAHAIKSKQISVSVIQRRFSIGYARAARIIDNMEDMGYIGSSTGNSKPRDVLMTPEQYKEVFGQDLDES